MQLEASVKKEDYIKCAEIQERNERVRSCMTFTEQYRNGY